MWLVHLNFRKSNQQMGKSEHLPGVEGGQANRALSPRHGGAEHQGTAGMPITAPHRFLPQGGNQEPRLRGQSRLFLAEGQVPWQAREGRCLRYQTGIKPNRPGFKPDGTPDYHLLSKHHFHL